MKTLITLIAALLLGEAVIETASAQSSNFTVSVTGTGPSVDEAKSDAIRQALQQAITQLVVVDRAVSGNSVLRDRVLSTMNGYVERFVPRETRKTERGVSVTADVTVSASRIENFIGIVASQGGALDGSSLVAEQNRRMAQAQAEIRQRKARGEIFDNVLRGFPSKAINIRVVGIKLSDTDPNVLEVEVEFSYNPIFVKAIEGTVKAMAAESCPPRERKSFTGYPPQKTNSLADMSIVAPRLTFPNACHGGGSGAFGWGDRDVVCFADSDFIRCYQMEPGDYCATCNLDGFSDTSSPGLLGDSFSAKGLVTYGRFVDDAGVSANVGSSCFEKLARPDRKNGLYGNATFGNQFIQTFIERRTVGPGKARMVAGFDLDKKYGVVTVQSSTVDLKRAKYFVAVGALARLPAGFDLAIPNKPIMTVVDDPSDDYRGCNLLEQAVQMRRLTGFSGKSNPP